MNLNSQISLQPTVISESKEAEVDSKLWKRILLTVVGSCLSALMVALWNQLLARADFSLFIPVLIVGGLYVAVVLLESFFVKSGWRLWLMALIQSVVPIVMYGPAFFANISIAMIGGVAALTLLTGAGLVSGARALEEAMKIRFFTVAKIVTPKVVTGIAIFLSAVLYVQYFESGGFDQAKGKMLFFGTLASSEPLVHAWIPAVSFTQSTQTFLEGIALQQLQNAKPDAIAQSNSDFANFAGLPPQEKNAIVVRVADGVRVQLEKYTGALDPKQSVQENLFRILLRYVQKWSAQTLVWTSVGSAVLAFLILKGFFTLIAWIVWFLAFLIFKALIAIDFAHIGTQTRLREFVILG